MQDVFLAGWEEVRKLRAIFATYPSEEKNWIKLSSVKNEQTNQPTNMESLESFCLEDADEIHTLKNDLLKETNGYF